MGRCPGRLVRETADTPSRESSEKLARGPGVCATVKNPAVEAKMPKALIGITGEAAVARKATAVVKDVVSMAPAARL